MSAAADTKQGGLRASIERTFGSLRVREFRYLSAGTLTANFADWANRIGTGWLVYHLTGSATQLGIFAFVSGMIGLASTPVAGLMADRLPRAGVVIWSAMASVVLAAFTAGLIFTDGIAVWHVYVLGSIAAVTNAMALPARAALVHDVTTPELLPNAVALNSLVMNVARLAGPPLFGVMAAWSTGAPFVAIVVLQILDALAIRPLGKLARQRPDGPKRNPLVELGDGVRYVLTERTLLSLFLVMFTASIIAYPYLALLAAFSEDVLGAGSTGYGLLFAMAGVGSIVGLLLLANLNPTQRRGQIMFVCYIAHLAGIAIFSQMDHLIPAMLILFAGGVFIGAGFALYYTLFQLNVRDDMRGRALAVAQMANNFFTVGALPMGLTVAWIGLQNGILVHVLLTGVVFTVLFFLRPEFRRL